MNIARNKDGENCCKVGGSNGEEDHSHFHPIRYPGKMSIAKNMNGEDCYQAGGSSGEEDHSDSIQQNNFEK